MSDPAAVAALTPPLACPSCRAPMASRAVAGHNGATIALDLCHACRGLWFDEGESLRLSPEGIVDLFGDLNAHKDDAQTPLGRAMACPRCRRELAEGVDLVRTGRYFTYRCPQRHGRFATFAAFMVEKGFVRQLTAPEIADLAERVRIIHCGSCGAPIDLRQHDACPYCHSALSLLDPKAVQQALADYQARAQRAAAGPRAPDLADALIRMEQDRERVRREEQKERWQGVRDTDDLWAVGLSQVWDWLGARVKS